MAALGFADMAIKQTAGKITPALGTLVYAAVAIVPPLLWLLWTRMHETVLVTREGLVWAGFTGLAFGIFTGLLFLLFSQGVDLSIGTPVGRMEHAVSHRLWTRGSRNFHDCHALVPMAPPRGKRAICTGLGP
jgi:hypothetical protein